MVPAGYTGSSHDSARRRLLNCAAMSKSSKRERQRLNREARREYELTLIRRRKMWRMARGIAIIGVPVLAVVVFLSVSGEEKTSAAVKAGCREVAQKPKPKDTAFDAVPAMAIDTTKTYVATIQTNCGSFTVQLAAGE